MFCVWCGVVAVLAVLAQSGAAQAQNQDREESYRRLTLGVNLPYLAVPVFQLHAELALTGRWSAALRAGLGKSGVGHEQWVGELGGQATYYLTGNFDRGMQVGLDVRGTAYEGEGHLFGLGDGLALGPYVGYKRVFGYGITLGAQLSVQGVLFGEVETVEDENNRVLPYLLLYTGWSGLPTDRWTEASEEPKEPARPPIDYREGFVLGVSIGPGLTVLHGCASSCELEPGMAFAAYMGWFLHPRVALVVDTNAAVALFSLSSGFGAFGFGLTGVGLQYWPLDQVWLKGTLGIAQMVASGVGGPGAGADIGGGMTLAAGWEFHQSNGFTMDLQARLSHGEFDASDAINDEVTAVDTLAVTYGLNWQ